MAKSNHSLLDQNSHFSYNPTSIGAMRRARFDLSSTVKTSFNVGQLVPFDVIEVLPGDTFDVETNILCRLQTLLTPIMDDLYLDVYYFFVPNRLVWDNWQSFCGENTKSTWYSETQPVIPTIRISESLHSGTILDYMGVPIGKSSFNVNALPVRAYNLIYNEWFRDENLQDPVLIDKGDDTITYNSRNDGPRFGGTCYKVNKYHDYFTSCLPSPQKGPDVSVPLGSIAPVYPTSNKITDYVTPDRQPMRLAGLPSGVNFSQTYLLGYNKDIDSTDGRLIATDIQQDTTTYSTPYPSNLFADLSLATASTINQLRLAFQTQKLYEKDARGGTRYTEILRSHFGVISPDARLQRPELLSYNHIPINVQQIVQNSESGNTPQGTTTAMSVTGNTDGSFIKSFVEHGYIIGLCAARYNHTYQQGLNRMWTRSSRFDFYWPVFSNIGEQPVLNQEIYLQGGNTQDEEVFGYNEAWADYRFRPSRTSGEMRSTHVTPLDSWHLGDVYSSLPALSDGWIQEDLSNVDRVLAVTSENANQLFMDIYIKNHATRPMPMYSIPGLIDHF